MAQHEPSALLPFEQVTSGPGPGLTLSMRASNENFGSRRSTSGANDASIELVGGIGPLNTPVVELIVGSGAFGFSGASIEPTIELWNVAICNVGDDTCGMTDLKPPADSSDDGPDLMLLMSNAVTL